MQHKELYHLHVELEKDYEPIRKRIKTTIISPNEMQVLRYQGKKHIDIWSDGRLYPIDPNTKTTPPFSNCTSLLKFMGDGSRGLLGYTHNLAGERDVLKLENHLLRQENEAVLQTLEDNKKKINSLEDTIKTLRTKQTSLGPRVRLKRLRNIETLKRGSGGCTKRIRAVR